MVQPGRSSLAARWRVRNADFTDWPSLASLPFTASTNDTGAGGPDGPPLPPGPPVTPDPALDPLWISAWEPFHGAAKKDFGFQVTLKVAAE